MDFGHKSKLYMCYNYYDRKLKSSVEITLAEFISRATPTYYYYYYYYYYIGIKMATSLSTMLLFKQSGPLNMNHHVCAILVI